MHNSFNFSADLPVKKNAYPSPSGHRGVTGSAPRPSFSFSLSPKVIMGLVVFFLALALMCFLAYNVSASDAEKQRPHQKLLDTEVSSYKLVDSSFKIMEAFEGLESAVQAFKDAGCNVGFCVQSVTGNVILAYNADKEFYSASSIKGPYVLSAMSTEDGDVSKTTKRSVEEAIIESSNEAYYEIKEEYGVTTINNWLNAADSNQAIAREGYSFLNITPKQLTSLWRQSWDYISTPTDNQQWLQEVYSAPKSSVISDLEEAVTWSKAGWINDSDFTSTVDAGIVERDGYAYIISVMSNKGNDFKLMRKMVNAIDAYIQATSTSLLKVEYASAPDTTEKGSQSQSSNGGEVVVTSSESENAEAMVEVSEDASKNAEVEVQTATDESSDSKGSSKSTQTYNLNIKQKK